MQQGRIVETGPSEAVWRNPEAAYTRSLIAAQPRLTRGRPVDEAVIDPHIPTQAPTSSGM